MRAARAASSTMCTAFGGVGIEIAFRQESRTQSRGLIRRRRCACGRQGRLRATRRALAVAKAGKDVGRCIHVQSESLLACALIADSFSSSEPVRARTRTPSSPEDPSPRLARLLA